MANSVRIKETATAVDEFQIGQTIFDITIQYSPEIKFNPVYTKKRDGTFTSVMRSIDLSESDAPGETGEDEEITETFSVSSSTNFTFFYEWEEEPGETKEQRWRNYTFFMKLKSPLVELEESKFVKVVAEVDCKCAESTEEKEPLSNQPESEQELFEIEDEDIMEIFGSQPTILLLHKHDSSKHPFHPSGISLTLTEYDFSNATILPLEVQKLITKRECFNELKSHVSEWLAPFDIKIKCKDGDQIDCHKKILTVRSPVFENMFSSGNFTEDRLNTIHATEFTSSAMKVILHFIYTGDLHEDWAEAPEEIVQGAYNYQLVGLLQFFDHHLLIAVCSNDNAVKLLHLAEQHALVNAKNAISKYIDWNFSEVFRATVHMYPYYPQKHESKRYEYDGTEIQPYYGVCGIVYDRCRRR